jgi:hypothetical protein
MARLFDVSPGPAGQAPGIWAAVEGVGYVHVAGPAELAAYRAGGTPEGAISYGQHLLNLAAAAPAAVQLSDAQVASMAATIGAAITAKLPTHITGTETTTVSETLV